MPEPFDGIIFAQGSVFVDFAGENIEVGELQDCSFEARDTKVEARGPHSMYPLKRKTKDKSFSFRCAFLKLYPNLLEKLTGGAASYDAGADETTLAIGEFSQPTSFSILVKTPNDGSDMQIKLYHCESENFSIPLGRREFIIPNFEAQVLVDPDTGKVFDLIFPGNLT